MASGPITSWQTDGGKVETVTDFIFLAPKSLQMMTAAMKLKDACSFKKSYTTFLCFLSREDPLAFVEELVWWC